MSDRPTEDQFEDPAEIGRHGCLIPEIEDDQGHCDTSNEEEDDE